MQEILIEQIIAQNKEHFTKEELEIINKNLELTRKIYLLAYMNSREIYK